MSDLRCGAEYGCHALRAICECGILAFLNDSLRRLIANVWFASDAVLLKLCIDRVGISDDGDGDFASPDGRDCGRHCDGRAEVAAHGIERDNWNGGTHGVGE